MSETLNGDGWNVVLALAESIVVEKKWRMMVMFCQRLLMVGKTIVPNKMGQTKKGMEKRGKVGPRVLTLGPSFPPSLQHQLLQRGLINNRKFGVEMGHKNMEALRKLQKNQGLYLFIARHRFFLTRQ